MDTMSHVHCGVNSTGLGAVVGMAKVALPMAWVELSQKPMVRARILPRTMRPGLF